MLDGHRPGDLRGPDADPLLAGLYDVADGPRCRRPSLADPVIARALGVRTLAGGPAGRAGRRRRAAGPAGRPGPDGLPAAAAGAVGGAGRPAEATRRGRRWRAPDRVGPFAGRGRAGRRRRRARARRPRPVAAAGGPAAGARPVRAGGAAGRPARPAAGVARRSRGWSIGRRAPGRSRTWCARPAGRAGHYQAHDKLTVDGIEVPWRYAGGEMHAATGRAWPAAWPGRPGQWPVRHLLAALLPSPDEAPGCWPRRTSTFLTAGGDHRGVPRPPRR